MAPHADDNSKGTANGIGINCDRGQRNIGFAVDSPAVKYNDDTIVSTYSYRTTDVNVIDGKFTATPKETVYDFKTDSNTSKCGLMLVGWGGNNGTTVTAGILANKQKLVWDTREGQRAANYCEYLGSSSHASGYAFPPFAA